VIVLGVHPLWLCERPTEARPKTAAWQPWFVANRKLVSNFLQGRLQEAREKLHFPNGGTQAVFAPATDPGDPRPESPQTRSLSAARLADHLARSAAAGRFDEANYGIDRGAARGVLPVLRSLRQIQARIVVLLMPERSEYRAAVPSRAEEVMREAIRQVDPDDPPCVVDLRDALDDSVFWDNYHLTMTGRERLSAVVAEAVAGCAG